MQREPRPPGRPPPDDETSLRAICMASRATTSASRAHVAHRVARETPDWSGSVRHAACTEGKRAKGGRYGRRPSDARRAQTGRGRTSLRRGAWRAGGRGRRFLERQSRDRQAADASAKPRRRRAGPRQTIRAATAWMPADEEEPRRPARGRQAPSAKRPPAPARGRRAPAPRGRGKLSPGSRETQGRSQAPGGHDGVGDAKLAEASDRSNTRHRRRKGARYDPRRPTRRAKA